jgi:two-component system response regulator PilR (NtrC family)
MARILVVDDDQNMRDYIEILLTREGYNVSTAPGGKEAIALCKKKKFDLVITDLKMPKIDGIELLKSIKDISPETMVILITGYASGETAVAAMKEGAYDYLEKNFSVDDIQDAVKDALRKKGVREEDALFIKGVEDAVSFEDMIGKSRQMLKVYSLIKKVADSSTNILILGESGTGKELVAKGIHKNSSRRDKPFVVINCGGVPENLLESEFFGYMKGSHSSAYADKPGLFEVAHRGTIFLDEIGDLSPFLQVKLLRVVQEKTFMRIGGSEDITVDVRIISATNQNLEKKVKKGEFREDLYYRLNVIPVRIPPLRERKDDIPLLINHFVEKYSIKSGKEVKKISPYALQLLADYPFPGNIRELENIIERSVTLETGNIILPENLVIPDDIKQGMNSAYDIEIGDDGINLNTELRNYEKHLVEEALKKANNSKTKAAKYLNVSYDSFLYRLEKLDIR